MPKYEVLETYTDTDLEGKRITLEVRSNGVIAIGSRFDDCIRVHHVDVANLGERHNDQISNALYFFRNIAVLLERNEWSLAWKCFKKASQCRVASRMNAFWNYFDGLTPKQVGRKWSVIQWVPKA